jgi:diguanylate cyclase (GGDEF)-like protein
MTLHLEHLLSPAPLAALLVLAAACAVLARRLAAARRRIEELTLMDTLTGLGNHRLLDLEIPRELARARRARRWLFFAMADVDRLEPYNALTGRPAGHALLAAIGSILRSSLRRGGDHTFRVGGDRFAFVFSAELRDDGEAMADRIRARIAELGLPHSGNPPHGVATVSVGLVTVAPDFEARLPLLVERAGEAIDRARANGRNCVAAVDAASVPVPAAPPQG